MLNPKVALVTGGSRGIGAATATALARAGAAVALTYRTGREAADTVAAAIRAEGGRALPLAADSTDPEQLRAAVTATVEHFGRLDILVNNAGVAPYGPFAEVTLEQVDHTLAVHPRAAFLAAQAALPHLGAGGRIISIGSSLANRVPYADFTLYAMSKSALIGLTKGLARDLGPRGITVNLVHPGSTATDMNPPDGPDAEFERGYTALGRYCDPADIAATVVHLAGPGGANITGAEFAVDAGTGA